MASVTKKRARRRLYRRAADWLLRYQGTPYNLAMGFAVGLFVALTPTVGFQMIIGAAIAHLLKANRTLPVALAWITNPFTLGPIYYFNYHVGTWFVPGDEAAGRAFIAAIGTASWTEPSSLWAAATLMARELWGVAGVLWLGSLVVATVVAGISYPIVWRIVNAERGRLERASVMPSVKPPKSASKSTPTVDDVEPEEASAADDDPDSDANRDDDEAEAAAS